MSDPNRYTVGWICALETEYVAARAFLNGKHGLPAALSPNDNNHYTLGEIGGHNVVIAVLPDGKYGTSSAASVARDMVHSFPNIRFGLMVGIGGGVPSAKHDIRLGDIVVSSARNGRGGLLQYDFGKDLQGQEFQRTGVLNEPPPILRTAVSGLRAQYEEAGHQLKESIQAVLESNKRLNRKHAQPSSDTDRLCESFFVHPDPQKECGEVCDKSKVIQRPNRTDEEDDPAIHYGLIASGNRVIKNAIFRDKLAADQDVLCFEMEAAGLMNHFPCLVIRGICDYSDSHKNKEWQGYAAMVAAAYARDLLCEIVPQRVNAERKASEVLEEMRTSLNTISGNVDNIHSVTTASAKKIEDVAQSIDLKELPIAEGAEFGTYMDQHEDECLPGTREDLLEKIEDWATLPEGKCIFWLNGLAGTGKSTISRTVAKRFQQRKLLGGSFFFKRGEGDRGNAARFFPTIARQLFNKVPELRPAILQAIKDNQGISMKPYKEQFEQLIYQPLSLVQLQGSPLVIVVDALDECEGENDIQIILQQLPRAHEARSGSLRFFITSRPELPIRLGFQAAENTYQDLVLHEIPAPVIERDISLFLEKKLVKIRQQRALCPNWPGKANSRALLAMSIPLFIFAATICRLFEDYNLDPERCLTEILQYENDESRLERTYLPVLNRVVSRYDGNRRLQVVQDVREVLGTIILLENPLSVASLSSLMGLTTRSIGARISSLHSVLNIPDDERLPVRIFHLSFRDFLVDPHTREKTSLWIDEKEMNVKLSSYCLSVMRSLLKKNICNLQNHGMERKDIDPQRINHHLPSELRYACRYWIHHVSRSKNPVSQVDYILAFLEVHFLHWVEVMSILGIVSEVIGGIASLKSALPDDNDLRIPGFLNDAKRFILKNSHIADIAPLQIYASGLLFAPKTAIVRARFERELPGWIHQCPTADERWGPHLQTLEGHSDKLDSVAFSPNSKLLASGASDGTIKLWDPATGMLRHTMEGQGHNYYSVIFSPDGQHLASATHYNIELWDPATGVFKRTLFQQHGIRSIAYSPDGRLLACGTSHGTITILDSVTGTLEHTVQGHELPMRARGRAVYRGSVNCVAYSPDGQWLASGSSDETIKLWDSATGALRHTLKVETSEGDAVYGVAFSPDGRTLASAHDVAGIMLWDPDLGALKDILGALGVEQSVVAFSPCGQFLASFFQNSIEVWDIITSELTSVLEGHSKWVTSVAFSSDGQLLASGAEDDTISVWDPAIYMLSNSQGTRQNSVQSVVFSPDGRLLASSSEFECTVKVWDPDTGTLKHTMNELNNDMESPAPLVFSFDNQILAAGSDRGAIRLWDLTTGRLKNTLKVPRMMPRRQTDSITISYNGQLIASGSGDNTVDIWDFATGTHRRSLRGHTTRIKSIEFSPNGQTLASGSRDKIKLWDAMTGALKHNLEGHMMTGILAFSLDGQLLASAYETQIKVWDPVTGALKHSLQHISLSQFSKEFAYLATRIEIFAANNWQGGLLPGFLRSINKPSLQDNRWVTLRGERKLWLPSDYTPSCSTVRDGAIAIGCGNGRVHVNIFSL